MALDLYFHIGVDYIFIQLDSIRLPDGNRNTDKQDVKIGLQIGVSRVVSEDPTFLYNRKKFMQIEGQSEVKRKII